MPSEERERSSRSSRSTGRSSESSRRSKKSSKDVTLAEDVTTAGSKIADTSKDVIVKVNKAKEQVAPVVNSVVEAMGGWKSLDELIKQYNPAFSEFSKDNLVCRWWKPARGPTAFLLFMFGLGVLQSILPLFGWILGSLAHGILGFSFVYNSGVVLLKEGFESRKTAGKVKSLLTVLMVTSVFEVVPAFLFDASKHLGTLWSFGLPALLSITPTPGGKTVAALFCDNFFAQIATFIGSILPGSFQGKQQKVSVAIVGGTIGGLLWLGYLGALGSYIALWTVLAFHTINSLAAKEVDKDKDRSGYKEQQAEWHNLLAIWLWRYLFGTVESIAIPGVISVIGLVLTYLPTYFMWQTAFMVAMLFSEKTGSGGQANTWYARWLLGVGKALPQSAKASPRSEESSSSRRSSGSSRESGSSSRSSRSSTERSSRRSSRD